VKSPGLSAPGDPLPSRRILLQRIVSWAGRRHAAGPRRCGPPRGPRAPHLRPALAAAWISSTFG